MAKLEPVQLDIITKSDGKGIDDTSKKIGGLGGTIQKLGTIAAGIGLANIGAQMVGNFKQFLGDSSQAANDLAKAMTTLDIIAPRFGESGAKAQQAAKDLGTELRIGTGPAAEGLQNLMKSGLSIDSAAELMKRFTNEAITGKSPSISLGQAVQNLSFAYATNNSALGNLSGVSENFSDITEKGREALIKEGVAANTITDDMAKFKGMMDLTNLTQGSAARFTGTLIDKQAELDLKVTKLKESIGEGLNKALGIMVGFMLDSGIIEKFTTALEKVGKFMVDNKEPIIAFTIGALIPLGIALATIVVPAIWGAVTAFAALMFWPTVIGLAVMALYLAWQNNFLGIQDIVKGVVNWLTTYVWPTIQGIFGFIGSALTTLWQIFQNVWNFLIKPLLSAFVTYFKNTFWTPIENVFKLMTGVLESMGLSWSDVWEGIKKVVFGILGAIVNEVKSKINFVIDIINGLINGANSIGGAVAGYTKINTIPRLAAGVENFAGGMARVGEQGPENVYLPKGSSVQPYSATGGASGGQRPIEVTQIINSGADVDFAFRELAYVLRTA